MNIVYSSDEFTIYQDDRKRTIFTIKNNNTFSSLTSSLFKSIIQTKLINNSTILRENNENKSILFKAFSVETFYQFKERHYKVTGTNKLPYNLLLRIIYSLSTQIFYLLQNESLCFYKLDISNILVIDNCRFIYLSQEDLKEVRDNKLIIYRPISKNQGYLSPEMKNTKTIPILTSYKTIYYSLGLLILDNIGNNIEIITSEETALETRDINKDSTILENELYSIKDTKLYYFLKRCLSHEPKNRFLLYI